MKSLSAGSIPVTSAKEGPQSCFKAVVLPSVLGATLRCLLWTCNNRMFPRALIGSRERPNLNAQSESQSYRLIVPRSALNRCLRRNKSLHCALQVGEHPLGPQRCVQWCTLHGLQRVRIQRNQLQGHALGAQPLFCRNDWVLLLPA